MAQPASKIDVTDTEEYLLANPHFRLCRSRGHKWPDPVDGSQTVGPSAGTWTLITDAAKGEPNAVLALACDRCGCEKRRRAIVDLRKQAVEFVGSYMIYPPEYLLDGGARITPSEAERVTLLMQLKPLESAGKTTPKSSAKKRPAERRLRAVS